MKTYRLSCAIATLFLFATFLLAPSSTLAQPSGGAGSVPVLTGTGSAEIKRQPDILYMTVTLQGRGSEVKAALASLEQRRQKALDKLAKLGANKDSIKFDEPTLSTGMTERQQQMQQVLRQQMRARGRGEIKMPEVATVSRQLTAEWPLLAETSEQLLLKSVELTKKIREADVAGANEADQLTPEEEELAEEMEGLREQMGMSDDESQPGDPHFVYLSRITDEQHVEAVGEAFEKAKAKAGELASATGAKLGPLWTLAARDSQSQAAMMNRRYDPYGRGYQQPDFDFDDGERMAIGYQVGEVSYTVYVQAAFRFEVADE